MRKINKTLVLLTSVYSSLTLCSFNIEAKSLSFDYKSNSYNSLDQFNSPHSFLNMTKSNELDLDCDKNSDILSAEIAPPNASYFGDMFSERTDVLELGESINNNSVISQNVPFVMKKNTGNAIMLPLARPNGVLATQKNVKKWYLLLK